ncbi:MAG: DUF2779 domain-containing protein [Pseudomonadota bacterium]
MNLSKSKILSYRQCPKRLWLERYQPQLAETSDEADASFTRGHLVGEVARQLYGPGELLFDQGQPDYEAALGRTRAHLTARKPQTLFEAAFVADKVYVMADVLRLTAAGAAITEVKSSGEVKDYHLEDCATQRHVIERAGLKVRRMYLAHINKHFVYRGDGDYRGLLTQVNIAARLKPLQELAPKWIAGAKRTLNADKPDIAPGPQCTEPFECPFHAHCNKAADGYPVGILPRISRKRIEDFAARGITDLRQIPNGELRNEAHERIRVASVRGKAVFDRGAAAPLAGLPYPRFYLDFETINPAVPVWAGTRPFQQIPFQWSLHIQTGAGRRLEHAEFLDLSGADPARAAMTQLLAAVGRKGPVFVYSDFEARVLRDMSMLLPDLAPRLEALRKRLVDLLPITKVAYYHPGMMGSWSIKAVLPTVAPDLSYENLGEVQDGGGAQRAFEEATDPATTPARRAELRSALLRYCGQDSLAMVRLAQFLQRRAR